MSYFKNFWNIVGLGLFIAGVLGVTDVIHTESLSASGAGFSFQGHGAWGLIAIGLWLCENPLKSYFEKRGQTPAEPPKGGSQ